MNTNQTVTGRWNVVETQQRTHGKWIHEQDFTPGEWVMNFYLNGRMSEDFCPVGSPRELRTGSWAIEPGSGIILSDFDDTSDGSGALGLLFDAATSDNPWLYFFEESPDARPTRDEIIARHAHLRVKLVAV